MQTSDFSFEIQKFSFWMVFPFELDYNSFLSAPAFSLMYSFIYSKHSLSIYYVLGNIPGFLLGENDNKQIIWSDEGTYLWWNDI